MQDDKMVAVHIDYATQDPSIPQHGPDVCPTCGVDLEIGFGLAGGGYGAYTYCPEHGVLSKTQTD